VAAPSESIYDSVNKTFDPDCPGFFGLEVSMGNDSFNLNDVAVYITTRDIEHAIQYQTGKGGEMGVGRAPLDVSCWAVCADLH